LTRNFSKSVAKQDKALSCCKDPSEHRNKWGRADRGQSENAHTVHTYTADFL